MNDDIRCKWQMNFHFRQDARETTNIIMKWKMKWNAVAKQIHCCNILNLLLLLLLDKLHLEDDAASIAKYRHTEKSGTSTIHHLSSGRQDLGIAANWDVYFKPAKTRTKRFILKIKSSILLLTTRDIKTNTCKINCDIFILLFSRGKEMALCLARVNADRHAWYLQTVCQAIAHISHDNYALSMSVEHAFSITFVYLMR